jgi:septal ring factor EnvC (AmiA/AmiB activator)
MPAASAAAVADGRVVYADRFLGYGVLVILDHSSGYYTLYGNLSEPSVTVGTHLDAGTAVGRVDDYLHFEIRRQGQPLDPLPWLLPK